MPESIQAFRKQRKHLICVDSDGCAIDTMDVKHVHCFGPAITEIWKMEADTESVLNLWNHINLYSMTRGINRFKGLALILEELQDQGEEIPGTDSFVRWTEESGELSAAALKREMEQNPLPIYEKVLAWSDLVNQKIALLDEDSKAAFHGVEEGLKAAHEAADVAVVSSATGEVVREEWEKEGLLPFADILLTQEHGNKKTCLLRLKEKGYEAGDILMVGDSPGDLDSAKAAGVLFYPILVKKEKESWDRFRSEALEHFLSGSYRGAYEEERIREFRENLS